MQVSVPWTSPFLGLPDVRARPNDWGVSRRRRWWLMAREAWRLRRGGDVLLCTTSVEALALCAMSLLSRRRIAVYDFLAPDNRWAVLAGRLLLRRVDRWIVCRRGDADLLARRYGVPPERCAFVPFPAERTPVEARLGDYVYAAGTAFRDWPTFLAAIEQAQVPAIVSSHPTLVTDSPCVDARALVTPDEGRALAAAARLVVVPMLDTHRPAGPLVVVDAQAAGKAVIASDVNGTRDYITHGETGWLVPPGDPAALASAIRAVWDDEDTLRRVGAAAARAPLTPAQSLAQVLAAATQ